MSDNIQEELDKIIAQLTPSQIEGIKEAFGKGEELPINRAVKKVLPKDKLFVCDVVVCCRLCGDEVSRTFKSASPLPSKMSIPTCGRCKERLLVLSTEELVVIAIKAADGEYARVKEAKNADVEYIPYPRKRGEEDE